MLLPSCCHCLGSSIPSPSISLAAIMSYLFKHIVKRPRKRQDATSADHPPPSPLLNENLKPTPILDPTSANLGLKVVYEPVIPSDVVADVVFVHGLTGNSYNTWTHIKSGIHWPSELLCSEVSNIRVAVFGYDADVIGFLNPVSNNRISSHAGNLLGTLARLRDRTDTVRAIVSVCLRLIFYTYICRRKIGRSFLLHTVLEVWS